MVDITDCSFINDENQRMLRNKLYSQNASIKIEYTPMYSCSSSERRLVEPSRFMYIHIHVHVAAQTLTSYVHTCTSSAYCLHVCTQHIHKSNKQITCRYTYMYKRSIDTLYIHVWTCSLSYNTLQRLSGKISWIRVQWNRSYNYTCKHGAHIYMYM